MHCGSLASFCLSDCVRVIYFLWSWKHDYPSFLPLPHASACLPVLNFFIRDLFICSSFLCLIFLVETFLKTCKTASRIEEDIPEWHFISWSSSAVHSPVILRICSIHFSWKVESTFVLKYVRSLSDLLGKSCIYLCPQFEPSFWSQSKFEAHPPYWLLQQLSIHFDLEMMIRLLYNYSDNKNQDVWFGTCFIIWTSLSKIVLESVFSLLDLNGQQPQRGTENKKRYSEIFRSLDALEITIGNEYVSKKDFIVHNTVHIPRHFFIQLCKQVYNWREKGLCELFSELVGTGHELTSVDCW